MPRKVKGQNLERLIIQPGRQLVFRQDGSITGQVTYQCEAKQAFTRAPSIGSPHPDHSKVLCYNTAVTILENELAEIVCDYLGITRDPTPPQVEFIGQTSEEPIETHLDFVSKIGGTKSNPKNQAKFDLETGEFLGFPPDADKELGGVRSYLVPRSTVRLSFFSAKRSWGLHDLGDIDSPPGSAGIPNPPGGGNWLKTNWSRRDFGLIYQITEEYTASGKAGWNNVVY